MVVRTRTYITIEDADGREVKEHFAEGDAVVVGDGFKERSGVINRIDVWGFELWTTSGKWYFWLSDVEFVQEVT